MQMAGSDGETITDGNNEGTPNAISSKLAKVLETRLENDRDTLDALKELSTFYTENTAQTRRNLRSKIEKRSLLINEEFVSAFRVAKESLDSIYQDVTEMNNCIQDMSSRLQATKTQTQHLIYQTTKLQGESKKISLQQDFVKVFLNSFQLSPLELNTLRGCSRDDPISPEFFTVLERVQSIHSNCRILMQSGHQTAALDIMEQMALYQEAALERLYRWTQSHCRNIETSSLAPLLTEAMSRLQDRPVLLQYVLDEYCMSRRSILVRNFIDALTQGGPGGTPKPIEHHVTEPKRYVGDMLAWLHQTIPNEKENLLTLLKGCGSTDVSEIEQISLSNITEGVCHPLKIRIEHILVSGCETTTLYSVYSLIRFYHRIIGQVVPKSLLISVLQELQELSQRQFLSSLENQVKTHLVEKVEPPPPDLSPSASISQLLNLLREILSVASVAEGRQEDLVQVVSCIIDPLLQSINEAASRLSTIDMSVYLLNCLYQMHSTLSLYEFMDERLERLQAQCDAQLDTVTSEQASSLVANLNLGPIYTILQEQGKGPLSAIPGMEPNRLKTFLNKMESFLLMPDMLLLPQIGLILSGVHRSSVQHRSFEVIIAIYKQIYDAIYDPENLYQSPATLLPRTPDQVRELLLQ